MSKYVYKLGQKLLYKEKQPSISEQKFFFLGFVMVFSDIKRERLTA